MAKSNRKKTGRTAIQKPEKPRDDFPLFAHASGQWAKKVRGKMFYFGKWDDPDGALKKYLDEKDDLHAGRTPRTTPDGLTVRELANRYLTDKRHLVDSGEITSRTWAEYDTTCRIAVKVLGRDRLVDDLVADDFSKLRRRLAKRIGPVRLGNEITRIKGLCKYAYDAGLIDRPVRYGPTFKRPSRKVLRKARYEKGPRMFEAAEVRRMIDATDGQLRAMILLGCNCGFGNQDIGTLPKSAVDLDQGWIDYPRPRTGIPRKCKLWVETVEAMKAVSADRPPAKRRGDNKLAFITKYGQPWAKETADSPVTKETRKLLDALGLHRPGLGFYALRHTFETIGSASRDQVAVDHVMGHARDDMASVYRERVDDDRLEAVSDHVHKWLFSKPEKMTKKRKAI